ncbi:hypothetical protein IC582_017563 [Cucumis melo]
MQHSCVISTTYDTCNRKVSLTKLDLISLWSTLWFSAELIGTPLIQLELERSLRPQAQSPPVSPIPLISQPRSLSRCLLQYLLRGQFAKGTLPIVDSKPFLCYHRPLMQILAALGGFGKGEMPYALDL